ncbi:hypothetical protein BDZ89DRAFT_1025657 [Hymenopellis radicata]|nr:hypothetical protein BDZ89DRAFT_1025657 [Hymenopellis radicata]
MLYPPFTHCQNQTCNHRKLLKPSFNEARLYTLHRGVLPVYDISLYCAKCLTRYHATYSVTNAENPHATRDFYLHQGSFVHVYETVFVEDALCDFFEQQMCHSHSSSTILARVYNRTLSRMTSPLSSKLNPEITREMVLEAFFLHALLRRCQQAAILLSIPHGRDQDHRLDQALDDANARMAGTGQPQYAHACDHCMQLIQGSEGNTIGFIHGGVTDGVTLGHTCCHVPYCQVRLNSVKDRYCAVHSSLADQCAVEDCTELRIAPHLTCAGHRELENQKRHEYVEKSKRKTEETRRLQKDSVGTAAGQNTQKQKKTPKADDPKKPKLRIARNYTHNEQLFIFCCGVIVSRATFFVAEAVSAVNKFLKETFPHPALIPSHIFYDNACNLLKHIRHIGDDHFKDSNLVVDVFHSHIHSGEDEFCQKNCFPTLFPVLKTADGKWRLNSSVAEQTNVWFGAFQAMTREMSAIRYNFFLDEMITLRNEWMVSELDKNNTHPRLRDLAGIIEEYENSAMQL